MSALCPYTCDVTYNCTNASKRKALRRRVVVYLHVCETDQGIRSVSLKFVMASVAAAPSVVDCAVL